MSDLHIGHEGCEERFRIVIDQLIAKFGSNLSDYVLVITGDLVNDANVPDAYQRASACLDVLRDAGFEHILVVPGNHDYGTGDLGDEKFVPLFKKCFYKKDIQYPKLDIIDGIAFIGLDSTAEELHWYDALWAEGELGTAQLERLTALLKSDKVCVCKKRVVYLHHHPFQWRPMHQLKDSKQLQKVLMNVLEAGVSIDALLFGHNHQGHAHNGQWGIPRCYDAGTSTLKPRPEFIEDSRWLKIKASTRIVSIESDNVENDQELQLLKES